jgi:hypothetical protein
VLKINFGIHLKVIILEILVGASGCTSGCTIPKEIDIVLLGDYNINIPLNPPLINIKLEFNPFLIYGRASKLILLAVVVESTMV